MCRREIGCDFVVGHAARVANGTPSSPDWRPCPWNGGNSTVLLGAAEAKAEHVCGWRTGSTEGELLNEGSSLKARAWRWWLRVFVVVHV